MLHKIQYYLNKQEKETIFFLFGNSNLKAYVYDESREMIYHLDHTQIFGISLKDIIPKNFDKILQYTWVKLSTFTDGSARLYIYPILGDHFKKSFSTLLQLLCNDDVSTAMSARHIGFASQKCYMAISRIKHYAA